MKFECPTCKLLGKIDDEKLAGQSIYANCPKCKSRFLINDNIKFDIEEETAATTPDMVTCPKCGFQQTENTTCNSCGIIFSKYKPANQSPAQMAKLKFMTVDEVRGLIGKYDFMDITFKNVLAYVSGIKEIDDYRVDNINEVKAENLYKASSITFCDRGIMLCINKLKYTAIKYSDISNVTVQSIKLASEVNKSVVGRAIVGGLVFGPLGAVIGGISGVGTNKIQYDYLISITYTNPSKNQGAIAFAGQRTDCLHLTNKFKEQLGSKVILSVE
ncbi:hypothetical protein EG832_03430 [bacterium]|nr:hypothetical protein [bacterium]